MRDFRLIFGDIERGCVAQDRDLFLNALDHSRMAVTDGGCENSGEEI